MKNIKVIKVGDEDVESYLNDGWEIITTVQNPYPQPYVFFFLKKDLSDSASKGSE